VRKVWPEARPLFVRLSATDWTDGGWDIDQSVMLARLLRAHGADLIDCSSGGNVSTAKIPIAPGYQVPFAERIRREANVATGAVGLITTPQQANEILTSGRADCVLLAARALARPVLGPPGLRANSGTRRRGRSSICVPHRRTLGARNNRSRRALFPGVL